MDSRIDHILKTSDSGFNTDILKSALVRAPIVHHERLAPIFLEMMGMIDTGGGSRQDPSNHDVRLITCHNYEELSLLERSLRYFNYPITILKPEPAASWRYDNKIRLLRKYLDDLPGDDIFLFCDASDVIFKRHPHVALEVFRRNGAKILFMSSSLALKAYMFMPAQYRWHFKKYGTRTLNSGVFIAEVEAARSMLNEAMKYVDLTVPEVSKERFQTQYQGLIRLGKKFGEDHSKLFPGFPQGARDQAIYQFIHPQFWPDMDIDIDCKLAFRT